MAGRQIIVASFSKEIESRVHAICDQIKIKYVPLFWTMPKGYPHGVEHWNEKGEKKRNGNIMRLIQIAIRQGGADNITVINIVSGKLRGVSADRCIRTVISADWLRHLGVEVLRMNIETFERDFKTFLS